MTVSALALVLAGCGGNAGRVPDGSAGTVPGGTLEAGAPPTAPADICTDLGPELLARLVPNDQRTVGPGTRYGTYASASCFLITRVAPQRDLGVILERHGTEDRKAACAQAMADKKRAGLDLFAKPSARPLPTMLDDVSDVSEARTEEPSSTSVTLTAVQVGLCRAGDLIMVQYRASGPTLEAVMAAVDEVARRVLTLYPPTT